MPVAALMTLFSSGVQGVGVSGWTLPDGSWDRGTVPTTCLWEREKNPKHTLVQIHCGKKGDDNIA